MHDNHIGNRGTTTALSDYAYYLSLQGHEICIGFRKSDHLNDPKVLDYLSRNYDLRPYENFADISINEQKSFDLGYFIKSGFNDGIFFQYSKSSIHAVFQFYEPHGNKYAYVSDWLANAARRKSSIKAAMKLDFNNFKKSLAQKEWVPHMINLPSIDGNLRSELGIPEDGIVGLRYGGQDTFDLDFVQKCVQFNLETKKNFWFIATNTKPFYRHPRLIYLPSFFDHAHKVALLNSANFFLHGRSNGESFGLSILEAMHRKIPVLSWRGGIDRHHFSLLSKESFYRNSSQLNIQINNILNYQSIEENYATSNRFLPQAVMPIFEQVFLN